MSAPEVPVGRYDAWSTGAPTLMDGWERLLPTLAELAGPLGLR